VPKKPIKKDAGKPVVKNKQKPRRTDFTAWAVERDGNPVFLHTQRANTVARYLLENRMIPGLESARVVKSEVQHNRSRFDFLLEDSDGPFFLEVKSVTLFGNGAALFPDAVTERGRHHMTQLAELGKKASRDGLPKPVVLFLVHSDRVNRFLPDYHTDLAFSQTFLEVRDHIRFKPVSIGWTKSFDLRGPARELPIPWDFLRQEVRDKGAYLLVLRIKEATRIRVGKLGELDFLPGWYVYVGSATNGLTARITRHLRKRKRFHWHIDSLRDQAVEVSALPIRSSKKEECSIAEALESVLVPFAKGFGSSDCSCPTHLFFSAENPVHLRRFHDVLERYRMPVISGT
jgi:sugar fermentation stimulation protein A